MGRDARLGRKKTKMLYSFTTKFVDTHINLLLTPADKHWRMRGTQGVAFWTAENNEKESASAAGPDLMFLFSHRARVEGIEACFFYYLVSFLLLLF